MYPIYFTDNICVKCGRINTIKTLDVGGNPISNKSNKDIRQAVCNLCGAEYILNWNGDSFYPIDKRYVDNFVENFNN